MYCPNCGIETDSDGQFCGSCGANLQTGEVVYGSLLPRVGFVDAIKLGFSNYFTFSGRSRRSEYWYWTLFGYLLFGVSILLEGLFGGEGGIFLICLFVTLIPSLSIGVRRLHDTGKSGWWMLIGLIPFGGIVLLVFFVQDSEKLPNSHGINPKYGS